MRRLATTLALATLAMAATSPVMAGAPGNLRLSWNDCNYVQNRDLGVPTTANLVVSLNGDSRTMRGRRLFISLGPNLQDAWRFEDGGCNSPGLLAISSAALNKGCPASVGATPIPINFFTYDALTGKSLLDMSIAHDPVVLNPATRYTVVQAAFDHQYSVAGPGSPGSTCGHGEMGVCLHLINAEFLNEMFVKETFGIENVFVTWNDAANTFGCPGPTQAEQSTWGRVKGLYR